MLNSDEYDSSGTARANARAWNVEVANNHWATVPLTDDEFRAAAQNGFPVSLTGSRPVPASWFGDLSGRRVLCIACGGGQQTVLLAARGAVVTSLENSAQQLQRDIDTCAKFGLAVTAVEGSMDDMHMLSASSWQIVDRCSRMYAASSPAMASSSGPSSTRFATCSIGRLRQPAGSR